MPSTNTTASGASFVRKYNSLSILDEVEDVEWYQPGGFYPLDVGETIIDRFKVVHKLGHGGIATVWFCWDLQEEKWIALKINSASHSSDDCPDLQAIRIIEAQSQGIDELNDNNIMIARQTFFIESPNGRHLCFVLPVAGPRFPDWKHKIGEDFGRLKKISYQLTKALAFLHSKRIGHGDFRPDNILMRLKPGCLDQIGYDEMQALIGEAIGEQLLKGDERSPHAPKYAYLPFSFRNGNLSHMISDDIAIVDFGESYEARKPPERLNIPPKYAGPEWLFGNQTGIENDIWSLAYTLLEVQIGPLPGDLWNIIRRMERYIGPVPPIYGPTAVKMLHDEMSYSDEPPPDYEENEAVTGPLTEPFNLQEKFEATHSEFSNPIHIALGLADMPRDEIPIFGNLLGELFVYDPEDRPDATQVLEHEWFKASQSEDETATDETLPIISLLDELDENHPVPEKVSGSSNAESGTPPMMVTEIRTIQITEKCPWYHFVATWAVPVLGLLCVYLFYIYTCLQVDVRILRATQQIIVM
ncbi:kinase-like protein [Daldinia vernicosa]|uniref:kinase-like protein n=1 Tax=Daldinia vernicosa TaxID=114800 RepID=UPI002007F749|nr:kinase-like protein [Daldinia vernicosa]KAI0846991.1 kinase-like protein [Daldinia vernicosa]